jgi:LuxR family transcriptional regulator, maltose regulon positive regulatory protein
MTVPLLATKLARPAPRPHLVRRLRLLDRVNAGVTSRLTLLSAPAGFGKTTLLAAWLAELPPPAPVAWLSLEPAERDPTRFLTYLLAALQTLAPSLGAGLLPTLLSPPAPSP